MRSRLGVALAAFIIACAVAAVPGQAQEAAAGFSAQIVTGTCESPGAISAALNGLEGPSGERVGSDAAIYAASSFSPVAVAMADLLAGDFAIEVRDAATGAPVACGEIGGELDGNGALAIGLRPADGSGFSGIAYLARVAGNPGQTGISLFLAETGQPVAADGGTVAGTPVATSGAGDSSSYVASANRQVTILTGSLRRIDALFGNPEPGESAWVNQVYAELTLWQLLYAAAQDLNPPADLEAFHQDYLAALELLDSAAVDIFQALETSDDALLDQAGQKIDQAIQALVALQASESD